MVAVLVALSLCASVHTFIHCVLHATDTMPMPLSNQYIDVMDEDMIEDRTFDPAYVGQLLESRSKIFDTMCRETGCTDYDQLRTYMFDTRSITKSKLAEWLETVCCILDQYAVPVLNSACTMSTELGSLKSERIADQKKIIELQEKIIEKKNSQVEEMKTVMQTTVKAEMESYSSVLTTTCSKALAPRRVKAALKTAADVEERSQNLIIYGIEEKKEESLEEQILDVFSHLEEKPRIVSCNRLGRDSGVGESETDSRNSKPVRVRLSGSDHVRQILKKKMKLREVEGCTRVYICPDRTTEQRVAHRKLVEDMKSKRDSEPGKRHYIRNNTVVSSDT